MTDLEVRELRYFQAVAEELNFSRAAERLGMAQPPLSRAILQLERKLGAKLFDRTTHRVTLTVAGLTLFDEAGRILDAIASATRRTARAALDTPPLVVTAKPGVVTNLLRRVVDAYLALPGAAHIEVVVSGYGEQASMARDGRADVALIGSPAEHRGLDLEPLTSEPRVAALPAGHALARHTALSCRDLAGLPTPQGPDSTPAQRAYWSGQDGESRPDLSTAGPIVQDSSQLLEAVALGQAVALIPETLSKINHRADIAYRPVRDASPYRISVAWLSGSRNSHTAHFVRTAIELSMTETVCETAGSRGSGSS